jgi:hypothetical protein
VRGVQRGGAIAEESVQLLTASGPPCCPLGESELGVEAGWVGGGGVRQLQQLGMALDQMQGATDSFPVLGDQCACAREAPAADVQQGTQVR